METWSSNIVSSCNTSLLQLGGNCVLVTACVSADTVSAKAYASHSSLGTGCSCSLYDVYYTMNTTLSTGWSHGNSHSQSRAYNQQHMHVYWRRRARDQGLQSWIRLLGMSKLAAVGSKNERISASRQTRMSRRGWDLYHVIRTCMHLARVTPRCGLSPEPLSVTTARHRAIGRALSVRFVRFPGIL